MKYATAILLALLLIAAPMTALAEAEAPESPSLLGEGQTLTVDLDGDGAEEEVSWSMVPTEYDDCLALRVRTAGGEELTYVTEILFQQSVYATDLDGDGAMELLLTGDLMSDDYCTLCLRYGEGELYEVLFPDCTRGDSGTGYYKYGYGLVTELGDGGLTLTGSQDMLGTWFCSRQMTLTAHDRFEFCDDGLWRRDPQNLEDDEQWQYGALTTRVNLPYVDENGNAAVLAPGTQLMITATDKEERAWFVTRDGAAGMLSVSFDYERGWGFLVDGVPEDDCLEYVPYAD